MAVTFINAGEKDIQYATPQTELLDDELPLSESDIETIAEIFQTPLTGAYNWDYTEQDDRIKKLYELGKQLNWDATLDINWEKSLDWYMLPRRTKPVVEHPLNNYPAYQALSDEDKAMFQLHSQSWIYSQFLHGEQGALLVASQLVSCAPTFNAKLYAGSQTFDEARHVEVFSRYIQRKIGFIYPVSRSLKAILDKILTDPRWDLKFVGMQILIEGLALGAFNTIKATTMDPVLRQLLGLVIRDEARHVTFGVNYLEAFIQTLSAEEIEQRAQFAYEACILCRERLMQVEVWEHWGFDVEECRSLSMKDGLLIEFQRSLFSRIIPNLNRIGLLTESIKPKFESLGLMEFAKLPSDADISWAELSRPLSELN